MKFILLFTLLLAPLAWAVPASSFLPVGESLAAEYNLSLGASQYALVIGSNGTAYFFDGATVVGSLTLAARLESAASVVGSESTGRASASVAEFKDSVSACSDAYADFVSSKYVCYDDSYHKYQCTYLWDQGFWREILPFDISIVRRDVEASLPVLKDAADQAVSFSTAGDYAGVAAGLRASAGAAENFSAANKIMLSYRPFRVDARLSRCAFNSSVLESALADASVASAFSSGLADKSVAFAVSVAGEPGPAAIANARARLSSYLSEASLINASVAEANRTFLLFLEQDFERVSLSLERLEDEPLPVNQKSFNSTLAEAVSRVKRAGDVAEAYVEATQSLSLLAGMLAEAPDEASSAAFNSTAKQYYALESALVLGSIPPKSDFEAVKTVADSAMRRLADLAIERKRDNGIPAWLIAGALIGIALIFGFAAYLRKRS